MSFAPPPGPPPPSIPEGWKAQFDDRYNQWFFINLRTGKSQWERPEGPAQEAHEPPSAPPPPPSYTESGPVNPSAFAGSGDKKAMGSNNPYNQTRVEDTIESDARLAAQLQAEEDAQSGRHSPANRGANAEYYSGSPGPQPGGYSSPQRPVSQNPQPDQQQRGSRGLLGRLMGKHSSNSNAGYGRPPPPPPQPQQYGHQPVYGGYPSPQAGYGYSGYPAQGGYYGAAQQQQPQRKHGMGTAGAAALGVGGGLLGGMLLADAVEDFGDHHDYDGPPPDDGGYDDGGFDDFGGGDF